MVFEVEDENCPQDKVVDAHNGFRADGLRWNRHAASGDEYAARDG
jgi:hypothetical protein